MGRWRILKGMSFFVHATPSPKPRTKNITPVSLLAAGIIAAMIATQLFTFENFPAVIGSLWLPGGEATARFLAAFLVILEVFSLPFLLSMHVSPLFRTVSMVCGWGVVGLWVTLTFWENFMAGTISTSGLFGATIPLPVGWWNVFFSLALGILIAWASWGMWPVGKTRKSRLFPVETKRSIK